MTTWPKIQIVTEPEPGADVVFDFNDWSEFGVKTATARTKWSLGAPQRMAAAGDARTAWGDRVVEFETAMVGPRSAALAAQSVLNRWLLQPEGWVRFQLDGATPPVWLRMKGATPGEIGFLRVDPYANSEDAWVLGITFDADPFLYGERVTLFDGTVPNDPTVAGGMVAPLGDVPGDAPMPLRVEMVDTGGYYGSSRVAVSHRVHSVPRPGAIAAVRSLGAGDGSTDAAGVTTTEITDATLPGGKARRVSSPPAVLDEVFSVPIVGVPYTRCRAYVGVRVQNPSGRIALEVQGFGPNIQLPPTGLFSWTDPVSLLPRHIWHDLGEFVHPGGLTSSGSGDLVARIHLEGGSNSTVDLSCIVLVPVDVDSRMLRAGGSGWWATNVTYSTVFDSGSESTWTARPDGAAALDGRSVAGGWPVAHYGASSLFLVNSVAGDPQGVGVSLDAPPSLDVTVSGHPQWLYLPSEGV